MGLPRQVMERLLISKFLLERIRVHPDAEPRERTLALHILAAHDAAELALAAISDARGVLPAKRMPTLLDYFESLASLDSNGTERREVAGKGYFDRLNHVRNGIKHKGTFPNAKEWSSLGEEAYGYVSGWCLDYVGVSLGDLDGSSLLSDSGVKARYDSARREASKGNHRGALEQLGIGLDIVFSGNSAVRGLVVGKPRAEDAIKLTGFGVHASDFLALQEFLPEVEYGAQGPEVRWRQSEFGHPANWRANAVEFCLRSFLDLALKIQDAEWIPGAVPLESVYENKITAIRDGVEIWVEAPVAETGGVLPSLGGRVERRVVESLRKGESLRGSAELHRGDGVARLLRNELEEPPQEIVKISVRKEIWNSCGLGGLYGLYKFVNRSDVKVTCVPRDDSFVREYFGDLPEIDWEPG